MVFVIIRNAFVIKDTAEYNAIINKNFVYKYRKKKMRLPRPSLPIINRVI